MQYTGLKDKNGKEIYEGDIVRTDIKMDEKGVLKIIFHRIFRKNYRGRTLSVKEFSKLGHRIQSYIDVEIIGNISENPNLLNK